MAKEASHQSAYDELRYRTVDTGEVSLHVAEAGDPGREAIVFLHGFPDDHTVWSRQMDALKKDFHVITFDMRGVGKSSRPAEKGNGAYAIDRVLPDIAAVIEATRGSSGRVHLVGHDWGSILGWSFVFHPLYGKKLLSWTSLSGPHLGITLTQGRKDLFSGSPGKMRKAAWQFLSSWYIYSMFIPGLWERLLVPAGPKFFNRAVYRGTLGRDDEILATSKKDVRQRVLNSLGLYRYNFLHPPGPPEGARCNVPTQVVVLEKDPFVRPYLFDSLGDYLSDLRLSYIDAGHWAARSHAGSVTRKIRDFVLTFK